MAKIDELTELLTEELNEFKISITKLEAVSKKIKDVKVFADTSNIEFLLKEHLKNEEWIVERQRKEIGEINNKIKKAKVIPKWLIVLYSLPAVLAFVTMGYCGYKVYSFETQNKTAYKNGKREINSDLQQYYSSHPEDFEKIRQWAKAQDSITSKK